MVVSGYRHRWGATQRITMSKATDPSIAVEANDSAGNVSMDDLIAQRTRLHSGELEPEGAELPESEAEEEPEEETVEVEETDAEEPEEESEVEEEQEEESEEGEAAIDIDAVMSLEPEQIQELASKAKSRLLSRVGELTARAKEAEAQIEQLKAQQPAPAVTSDIPPQIRQYDTPEKVEAAMEGYERTLEITRKVLRENADYDSDDVIYEEDGQKYTKAQLETAEQGAINALSKHLPRQLKRLEDVAKFKQANESWIAQAKKEVPEIQDDESDIGKTFAQLVSNPNVKRLKELSPELTVDLEYIFAHAVNSIKGAKKPKVQARAGSKLKVKPPASPVGSGAAKGNKATKGKAVDRYSRFAETGSEDDWVAARIARMSGH